MTVQTFTSVFRHCDVLEKTYVEFQIQRATTFIYNHNMAHNVSKKPKFYTISLHQTFPTPQPQSAVKWTPPTEDYGKLLVYVYVYSSQGQNTAKIQTKTDRQADRQTDRQTLQLIPQQHSNAHDIQKSHSTCPKMFIHYTR